MDLDTEDFNDVEEKPTTTVNHKGGSVWRDIVVGEQMEGCLTRLEVTPKTAAYTDMDDPNYEPKYDYVHLFINYYVMFKKILKFKKVNKKYNSIL